MKSTNKFPGKNREEKLRWYLKQIANDFGYGSECNLPLDREASCLCFCQNPQFFKTEAVCFQFKWRPQAILAVDFFGSPLTCAALRHAGLEGNVVVDSLFAYQTYRLLIPSDHLLGETILIGREEKWPESFLKIREEMSVVHPSVWQNLWQRWHKIKPNSL